MSGFITPNSYVDVLVAAVMEGSEDREQRSKLILQNVKVLAIGTTIEQQDNKPIEVPMVTLLVSPEDAEKLTLATRQDAVRLALRNYRDNAQVTTSGSSLEKLFGTGVTNNGGGVARPKKPALPTQPSVEILLGDTRTRQQY